VGACQRVIGQEWASPPGGVQGQGPHGGPGNGGGSTGEATGEQGSDKGGGGQGGEGGGTAGLDLDAGRGYGDAPGQGEGEQARARPQVWGGVHQGVGEVQVHGDGGVLGCGGHGQGGGRGGQPPTVAVAVVLVGALTGAVPVLGGGQAQGQGGAGGTGRVGPQLHTPGVQVPPTHQLPAQLNHRGTAGDATLQELPPSVTQQGNGCWGQMEAGDEGGLPREKSGQLGRVRAGPQARTRGREGGHGH
jgi:hypothetical protein